MGGGDVTWGEFEIINRFFRDIGSHVPAGVLTGIGDDAALIRIPNTHSTFLITHDMMVEDIHFKSRWMSPFQLARKLVKVNVSDVAAMGGTPLYALLSIALPDPLGKGWLENFSKGLDSGLKAYNLSLIGGDTSKSPSVVMVALTLLGKTDAGPPVLRHAPNAGDFLYVTGTLGDAALGLIILNQKGDTSPLPPNETPLVQRHLDPTPRLDAGREIASKNLATAMIDISDGLLADLGHLLENSGLGAEIHLETLPLSEPFRSTAPRYHPAPDTLALSGGEDYELLFSSPYRPEEISALSSFKLTFIGTITTEPGIKVLKNGIPLSLETRGFQHLFHQKG